MPTDDPVLVKVIRHPIVESTHRGAAAVTDPDGRLVACWGDVARPVYPRSAVKPIQALPLLETGAAEAFGLGDAEVALACASHGGEPEHVDRIAAWLGKLGLPEGALACGGHPPATPAAAAALVRQGKTWTRLHDNCSGKHSGFLTTAALRGEPVAGYERPDHPVQRRVTAALADLTGTSTDVTPCGTDGCGIPVFGFSLISLATAAARFAAPEGLAPTRTAAIRHIRRAMAAHPHLVAGTGRFDTAVIAATDGRVLVKGGAEGVHMAILPEARLGVAVKVDDGAGRASGVALGAILERLGALDAAARAALTAYLKPAVQTRTGTTVGIVQPSAILFEQ